jgi:hypothetical protein
VGLGLYCFYGQHADTFREYAIEAGDAQVLPIFVATVMPAGLKGLLVVGLLAAAISSLDSALAALAQTTVRSLYVDVRHPTRDEKSQVHRSRLFTLAWGALLCLMAMYFESINLFEDLVSTALKTTSFTYGALLGAMLLALVPHKRDGRGLVFGAPLAVLSAIGLSLHQTWSDWIILAGLGLVLACWFYTLFRDVERLTEVKEPDQYMRRAWFILLADFPRTIWLLASGAMVWYLHFSDFYRQFADAETGEIAWPWYLPIGVGITLVLGYLLSRPKGAMGEGN